MHPQTTQNFLEIEQKFLVENHLSRTRFLEIAQQQFFTQPKCLFVTDTYFLTSALKKHVFRHRIDAEIQEFTLKSLEHDALRRTEVNLKLESREEGLQLNRIRAFLEPLGILWEGTIQKEIAVFSTAECEVVYYDAGYQNQTRSCLEIELLDTAQEKQFPLWVEKIKSVLGIAELKRTPKSLIELFDIPELQILLKNGSA